MQKYTSIVVLILMLFTGCVKDKPNSPVKPQVIQQIQLSAAKKVYVINEGPFPTGNGSVSLYDPGSGEVIENYYELQNHAQVGNIAQSLNYIKDHYYIVVNNANKIIVCDPQFKKTAEISNLRSPRYILQVTSQKAYVSDLYSNAISIVDLNTNTKTGEIPCYGKTEKMVLIYNKVFVTNTDRDYVYIINMLNDQKTDSIFVGKGAGSLVIDKSDKIWVLGSGDKPNTTGRLTKINAISNQVETFFNFGNADLPASLCINKTKDTLYFLNDHIFRMPVSDNALPANAFVTKGTKNFYGLGVNPNDYNIYAADALDYIQKSNVYIFNPGGGQVTFFKTGIASNGFYFE